MLCVGWLVVAPAAAQVFDPETFTLANGLQVVAISNHRSPIVAHMVWYKAGAADEAPGKSGIAHFLEHLMFKGTSTLAPGEFSKIVARNGGRDNAFTGPDYTGYFQNVARDRLELVMRIEADRMANLVLSDAEVTPERDVILEERRQAVDNNPRSRLREQVRAALYLNHPYGRPIIGWEHEIRGLTTADAIEWYRRFYAPNNAVLIVAGDITAAELRPLAEKYYGAIPARAVPERARPQEPPHQSPRRVELKDERVRQSALSRVYLAPSYVAGARQHAYALQVLAEVFGGGATSRLHRALVVEHKLATSAGSYYDPEALDESTFGITAALRPGVEMGALEAKLDEEIRRLLAEGVTAHEVARATTRMRASAVYARDSLQAGARAFGAALATGRSVADVETWPQSIAAVTAAEVDAAARAVLREARSVTGLLLPGPGS
ncbi:MAG: M16 family metallopeptidase [Pseudomonadota bacterium]